MKFIFVTILFISMLNAGYEKIKIGKISNYHKDKISPFILKQLLDEIEQQFESQLGYNVFDYSSDGKPIDLLYISPSTAQKRVERKISQYERKVKKSQDLIDFFKQTDVELDKLNIEYKSFSSKLNDKIISFNSYVENINKIKKYPKEEFEKIKNNIALKKADINEDKRVKKRLESKLRLKTTKYNNRVIVYNNLTSQINHLAFEIESLNRSLKIVKGQAIGQKVIKYKTYLKDGKYVKEKSIEHSMNKIEIYSFESLNQLKVILAHEIAHLVGIPHIDVKGALMNPILQDNQVKNLKLTYEDIMAFDKYFK